jgi:hypothetical protein
MEDMLYNVQNAMLTHCRMLHVTDIFSTIPGGGALGGTLPGRLPPCAVQRA